ncbi:MAG: type II toxin-antitoxin system PemK/MazF family toxin [Gammaproteobacteria bacterium]|jgi:mRNA interferase MazF|nr:type II toxin-antitoxin system PemK/MazF family toxin [Gammaproteobacteria bacterium]
MRRGEAWWICFDPAIGGEIKKTRPAVIISNNAVNKVLNRVQVIPLTSNTDKLYPCEAYVWLNGKQGKAMADQIATVSKRRLCGKIGAIKAEDLAAIEQALKIQLGLR